MFFAFVGTFASTFVVGGLVWQAGQMGFCYPLGLLAALVFGSLISATDPVTVLAVFQKLGVKVDLFSMVFGESVLNDAVAIVLSRTLLGFNRPGTEVNSESIMAAVASFCTIFGGSLLIGAFYGIVSALVFKKLVSATAADALPHAALSAPHREALCSAALFSPTSSRAPQDMRHHAELIFMQSSLSFAFPWAAYFTSEALELSGIVTILFCGMIMAVYTRYNFSAEARVLTAQGYKCVAQVAETYVFVYLGMAVFTFPIFEVGRSPAHRFGSHRATVHPSSRLCHPSASSPTHRFSLPHPSSPRLMHSRPCTCSSSTRRWRASSAGCTFTSARG